MPTWLATLSVILLAIMLIKAAGTVVLARRYHRRRAWDAVAYEPVSPRVTVIVPAYNERSTIANCLEGLSQQTYPHVDVLVVDDGSTDDTSEVAERAGVALDSRVPINVTRKGNGGKASALNYGVLMTAADVVVCVDADSVLAPDAIARIVEPFADPSVGAVGGMVKVANSRTVLGRQQAMEYIAGLTLQRAAFAELDSVQVLSGAISAFRRDVLKGFGGYSRDTIVEDFDITVAVQASGHRVVLHPEAVAYTEGPLNLGDLSKQRYRWTFGGFQVLRKYRSVLFTDTYGRLSRFGLPYFLIFPWFDVLVSVLFATTLVYALTTGGLLAFAIYLGVMSLISLAMNLYALHLTREPRRLALWGLLTPLFYAHVLTWTTARAGWGYLTKKSAEWDSLERGGHNVLASPNPVTTDDEAHVG
ncbi:MAG: glycosyltransferase family 2 protein [Candidatus Nanopelagicales bacterium]|nr:glycosyltransferase family 2 protein [Candidatus Nanopelagicales bacterium]